MYGVGTQGCGGNNGHASGSYPDYARGGRARSGDTGNNLADSGMPRHHGDRWGYQPSRWLAPGSADGDDPPMRSQSGVVWDLVVLVGGAKASAASRVGAADEDASERQTAGGLMAALGQDVWSLVGLPEPGGDTRQELVVDDSRLGVTGFASAPRWPLNVYGYLRGEAARARKKTKRTRYEIWSDVARRVGLCATGTQRQKWMGSEYWCRCSFGQSLADVATVGPSVEAKPYIRYDWISVGVRLTISIPVPLEVAGETAPVPHFVTILARTMFHGGDRFTYFGTLGVGLSYYGIPECESRCQSRSPLRGLAEMSR